MHALDRVAGTFTKSPRFYEPVFADGWGDDAELEGQLAEATRMRPIPRIATEWESPTHRNGYVFTRGTFVSPAAEDLPPASRIASVLRVEPDADSSATCLIMAAFNDHGYRTRIRLATLLADRGIDSVLLENPYYGTRRPKPGQALRTVVDFFAMGSAAVLEGRALLSELNVGSSTPVGVAGYSMGGNIAALISATVPFPIATAGLAASHSPGPVWTEGLLASAISWEALGGTEVRDRLAKTLGHASALNFPAPSHTAVAVLANPVDDGYIPRSAFEALHRHWPGSEMRWIPGGHTSVMLWRKRDLVQAIVDSFKRFNVESHNVQSGPTYS